MGITSAASLQETLLEDYVRHPLGSCSMLQTFPKLDALTSTLVEVAVFDYLVVSMTRGPKASFLTRLDPSILGAIKSWAEEERRSVTAHIEYLLAKALKDADRLGGTSKSGGSAHSEEE